MIVAGQAAGANCGMALPARADCSIPGRRQPTQPGRWPNGPRMRRKLVRVVGDEHQPRRAALVVGEPQPKRFSMRLGAMLPGVLVEEDLANVLLRDGVCLAMKLVAVRFVFVIAHGGGHLEELEEPVVVGEKEAAQRGLAVVNAWHCRFPPRRRQHRALRVRSRKACSMIGTGSVPSRCYAFDLLLILHKRAGILGEICAIWPLNGATRQIHLLNKSGFRNGSKTSPYNSGISRRCLLHHY